MRFGMSRGKMRRYIDVKLNLIKMKKFIYILTAFTFIFIIGCSVDNDLQFENEKLVTLEQVKSVNNLDLNQSAILDINEVEVSSNFYFSDEEIKFIGTEHNKLCKGFVDAVNSRMYSSYLDAFNSVLVENRYNEVSNIEFNNWMKFSDFDSISTIIESIENVRVRAIMSDFVNITNEISFYQSYKNNLDSLREVALNELSGINLTSVLISIEVAQNSAKMWLPISSGGEGYYDKIRHSETDFRISLFGKVVCADAIGAYLGFLHGALPYLLSGGPANPISNAYLAGEAVLGAAGASSTAAL